MDETADDVTALQQRLDESFETSGAHLRTAFSQERPASADALVAALPGIVEIHFAVVTSDGAPLVAPVDAILYRGRVWIGLPPESVRARLVRKNPSVSASYNTPELAFIVHGEFTERAPDDDLRVGFDRVARELYVERYGDWFNAWLDERLRTKGAGPTGFIEPRRIFARLAIPES